MRSKPGAFAALCLAVAPALPAANRHAEAYIEAIEKINAAHAKDPGDTREDELAKAIPRPAVASLARLLKEEPSDDLAAALLECGEAALDLAAMDHFQRIRARLLEVDPDTAATLGDALARDRFLVRAIGAFEDGYLDDFADVTDAILDAYHEVFAFAEWSKVPGKKIRIRVHIEDKITRPPHFAPQFPWHSEVDLPVLHADRFRSPTQQGHMMFYGLCHELGHLIAMWGDRDTMEDHHAWAHYTGVTIVEHIANNPQHAGMLEHLRDARWRSLEIERKQAADNPVPSTKDREGVMALLIRLHDTAGPKAIGAALNLMDEKDAGHRLNHVRYYTFDDFERALVSVLDDDQTRQAVRALFRASR